MEAVLQKVSAKKAPGPDKILNGILQLLGPTLIQELTRVFNSCLRLGYYPKHFRVSITVILQKPQKDDYIDVKLYRPVALLNTLGKLLDAVVAGQIAYMAKKSQMLPTVHMGGCKGQSTDHALHHLVERIHAAWDVSEKEVASLLLLDVSGYLIIFHISV